MQTEKILVILPNYIGDALMTTPAIRLIKKISPTANIIALVSKCAYDIIKDNPNIEQIVIRKNKLSFSDRLRIIRDIKKVTSSEIILAILFRDTFFNRIVAYFSGAKITAIANDIRDKSYKEICLNTVENVFRCKTDKANYDMYDMDVFMSQADREIAEKFLYENSCEKFIVINPVSSREAKMWNIANYSQLIDNIFLNYHLKTVIIGSKEDLKICKTIYDRCNYKPVIASGKLSLIETAAVIEKSQIFISPDTGPLHISIALKKKTIALFGSTNPAKYGPYPDCVRIIYNRLDCSPCYNNICQLKKSKNLCMNQITVEEVINQIELIEKKQ